MPKEMRCAECGIKIEFKLRAIPQTGKVITIIFLHKCEECEEIINPPSSPSESKDIDKPLYNFPYVEKLNKVTAEYEIVNKELQSGDKRDKDHLRKELVTSTAPLNILDSIKGKI